MSDINILKEAIEGDPVKYPMGWDGVLQKAKDSPFYNRVLKEGLFSDMSQALGAVHDRVIKAAKPAAIGRDMIWVVPTTEALVRFFTQSLAKAYVVGETAPPVVPERMSYTDIQPTTELACKGEFKQSYLEDANWNVLERQIKESGRSIAQLETEKIIALYTGISADSLAGGGAVSVNSGSSFAWSDVVSLWTTVKKENFTPKVLVINPAEAEGLLNDDKFLHANYYAPESAVREGEIGSIPWLGMKVLQSTLMTAGTCLCIDTDWAAALVVRRDITTVPYEDPGNLTSGVMASERIGLGTLRTAAVAKGT